MRRRGQEVWSFVRVAASVLVKPHVSAFLCASDAERNACSFPSGRLMRLSLACAFLAGPERLFRLSVSGWKRGPSLDISRPMVATLGTPIFVSSGMGRIFFAGCAGSVLRVSLALRATAPVFLLAPPACFPKRAARACREVLVPAKEARAVYAEALAGQAGWASRL